MEPNDPKRLSDEEAEMMVLLGDATMGSVKEAKKAIAELLRRGVDIKAGAEVAERLIEILDPPRGRPNKKNARTLYSNSGGKHANDAVEKHDSIRAQYKTLWESGEYKTKVKLYRDLAIQWSYSESRIKSIVLKPTKKD
jgi:hypothetical protein